MGPPPRNYIQDIVVSIEIAQDMHHVASLTFYPEGVKTGPQLLFNAFSVGVTSFSGWV